MPEMSRRPSKKKKNKTAMSDIKYDLLKIMEPYNGIILSDAEDGNQKKLRSLYKSYLEDLRIERRIYNFSIDTSVNEKSMTYEIGICLEQGRRPKKLKIHVGLFKHPWIGEEETVTE